MARQAFNKRWAENVETQDSSTVFQAPGDIRIGTGWEGGQDKDAPPAGQENWWHNRVDSALQDIERHGVMTWHAEAVYDIGAPSLAVDGLYYESIADNNVGNAPPSSSAYWRLIGASLYSSFSVGEYKDVAHNGSPDSGWLKCNGAVLLKSAYPKLFARIGGTYNAGDELSTQFRLPDWRGMFPRFLDDGRGVDSGRVLGNTPQPSQNLAHGHSASTGSAGAHTHTTTLNKDRTVTTPGNAVYGDENFYGTETLQTNSAGAHVHTVNIGSSGGTEARSINLVQVRWIRYL
ncbi:Microcystin-dependent protein [Pseudomonas sp. NFACC02]|uniref:tail fiber protein n=1 Tax=Pseudomonas sp. NFACC02 TaxID=1566250 RepID=UPI0008D0C0BD|nr:tail fiber protein [Pseudomonas sp. NFACC02]SEP57092.1 Microcystin-dependent protein [Pseudomonas sp. NFACC02]